MSNFFKVFSIVLLIIAIIFSIKWYLSNNPRFEPIIVIITTIVSMFGFFIKKRKVKSNRLTISGNDNKIDQLLTEQNEIDSSNEMKVIGDRNRLSQKSKQ